MSVRRIARVTIVGITFSMLLAACGSSSPMSGGTATGCLQRVHGATGAIQRETSGLSCRAINRLISSVPSEPQGYSILGGSPRLLWNCKFYGLEGQSVLLRCQHDERQFSIVGRAG